MSTIKRLREIVSRNASPSARFVLSAGECAELLREADGMREEIGRLRANVESEREACARVCDEKARRALDAASKLYLDDNCSRRRWARSSEAASDCDYDDDLDQRRRIIAESLGAEECAAAIRARRGSP